MSNVLPLPVYPEDLEELLKMADQRAEIDDANAAERNRQDQELKDRATAIRLNSTGLLTGFSRLLLGVSDRLVYETQVARDFAEIGTERATALDKSAEQKISLGPRRLGYLGSGLLVANVVLGGGELRYRDIAFDPYSPDRVDVRIVFKADKGERAQEVSAHTFTKLEPGGPYIDSGPKETALIKLKEVEDRSKRALGLLGMLEDGARNSEYNQVLAERLNVRIPERVTPEPYVAVQASI